MQFGNLRDIYSNIALSTFSLMLYAIRLSHGVVYLFRCHCGKSTFGKCVGTSAGFHVETSRYLFGICMYTSPGAYCIISKYLVFLIFRMCWMFLNSIPGEISGDW